MTVTTMERQKSTAFHRALERVAALPGVSRAAFAWGVPLTGNKWRGHWNSSGPAGVSNGRDRINLPLRSITPDYFDVMGIGLSRGGRFRNTDNPDAPRVAIVNQTLARCYFGGRNPVGRPARVSGSADKPLEVVGMIADTRTEALSETAEPEIYLPFWQSGAFSKHLVVRTTGEPLRWRKTSAARFARSIRRPRSSASRCRRNPPGIDGVADLCDATAHLVLGPGDVARAGGHLWCPVALGRTPVT